MRMGPPILVAIFAVSMRANAIPASGESWGFELRGTTARTYAYPASQGTAPRSGVFAEVGVIEFGLATFSGTGRASIRLAYARPGFDAAEWLTTSCAYAIRTSSGGFTDVALGHCEAIAGTSSQDVELPFMIRMDDAESGRANGEYDILSTGQPGGPSTGVAGLHGSAWVLHRSGATPSASVLSGRYSGQGETLYSVHESPKSNAAEMTVPPDAQKQTLAGLQPADGWYLASGQVFLHGVFQPSSFYLHPEPDGGGTAYCYNPTDLHGVPGRFHFVVGPDGDFLATVTSFVPGNQEHPADPDSIRDVRRGRFLRQ